MKLSHLSCLALFSLVVSACSGSNAKNDSVEAGVGDVGRQETGNKDVVAKADLATDGTLAKADIPRGDTSSSTSAETMLPDSGAGAPIDALGGGVDAPTTSDVPTARPEVGRDLGLADTNSAKLDTALATSPDSAPGKLDTFPSSGNATVDRLAVAAALCGPQTFRTVPVGWQMVMVGEGGCTMEAPPLWTPIGAGTPTTFVVEDKNTRVTGSSVMAGVDLTNTVTCTPHGVVTWMFAKNTDCVGFKELDWKEKTVNVAGLLLPTGDLVYSCTQGGVPIVGYMMVQIEGTSPWCNMLVEAFWMPETQIEKSTCTLTQTLNSIQCPKGGSGCDDSTCRADCVSAGNASGACTSDDSCMCTN
jgi:hypothetical protein